MAGEQLYELSTPVQIAKCPYCGKDLSPANYKISNTGMEIVLHNLSIADSYKPVNVPRGPDIKCNSSCIISFGKNFFCGR